jgi:hypothetical protein
MNRGFRFLVLLTLLWFVHSELIAQAEDVPAYHPVYTFLKRMEVKGIIERYRDAVLPLSRRQVGEFLQTVSTHSEKLTAAECGWLHDFLAEFKFDIGRSTEGFHSLIGSEQSTFARALGEELTDREKFFYVYTDSAISLFFNGLLDFDLHSVSGTALGNTNSEYVQFGGRFRGTLFNRLGYSLQGTNAQFWGSRALLERDPYVSQSHALYTIDAHNFDFSEGYVRYDAGMVSAQLGRERLLWGNGYDQKMIVSDNVRVFDFVRADFEYKAFKYTFIHAWLLGTQSLLTFSLPFDTTAKFYEPVIADKYFVAHRFSFSFPSLFEIGFQEMYIYSNRSPDLGYLNPLVLLESLQRARGERDNGLWAFDIKTNFLNGLQLTATMLYDDIHIPYLFSHRWFDKYAYQVGMMYTDAFFIANTTLFVEYTHVEPFVFGHERSRDNQYSSLGVLLGPRIGPNADSWFFRWDYLPTRNLILSARVTFERKGQNVYDSTGALIQNVGGDFMIPHRDTDPVTKSFLAGNLLETSRIQLVVTYEIMNQMWLDGILEYERREDSAHPIRDENTTFIVRLRTEL